MESLKGGRYVVHRLLGEGGQGSTHEAVDERDGRLVAIKRFVVREAQEWKGVELAEREARVLAQLSHPSLPAYVEHFEEDGALYLVMERIPGVSVEEFVKRGGAFDEKDVVRFLEQASVALAYLHSRTPPVVHRDIKPKNVLRRPNGDYALVDFGAVTHRLKPQGGSTIVGTFGYMAPEQFQGRASPASDVYAAGATALWMLTNMEPEDLPHKGLGVDVAAALGSRASPALVTVLAAMLEPDPDKRPKSIGPLLHVATLPAEERKTEKKEEKKEQAEREEGEPPGPSPAVLEALHTLGRFLPLIWVGVGFAWWLTPFGVALGVTIGTIILQGVRRAYLPRIDRMREWKRVQRKYGNRMAVRVHVPEERDAEEGDAEEVDEPEEEEEAPKRARRRR